MGTSFSRSAAKLLGPWRARFGAERSGLIRPPDGAICEAKRVQQKRPEPREVGMRLEHGLMCDFVSS